MFAFDEARFNGGARSSRQGAGIFADQFTKRIHEGRAVGQRPTQVIDLAQFLDCQFELPVGDAPNVARQRLTDR
jgi:hypothetical protein